MSHKVETASFMYESRTSHLSNITTSQYQCATHPNENIITEYGPLSLSLYLMRMLKLKSFHGNTLFPKKNKEFLKMCLTHLLTKKQTWNFMLMG